MTKKQYEFGWRNPREFFDTNYKEPSFKPPSKEWGLIVAYVALGVSISMVVAPMAWVKLFQWILL